MFAVGERESEGAESVGRVSRRYMRMKPSIKESPIQTCGVRAGRGVGVGDGVFEGLSRMWTSLGEVGVEGGV